MFQTIKAIISFIQVLLLSAGIIPVNTNIDYGGGEYQPPQVTTPMYIVENGKSDFVIVTADNPDECIQTAAKELQT